MASIPVLVSSLAAMMIMVAVGFAIVRIGLLKTTDCKALSALTVYVLQPCLIVRSFQIDLTRERLTGFFVAMGLGVASYLAYIALTRALRKPLRLTAVDRATLIYSNAGNLILPLVSMVLGEEYVFYGSAMQIPFNLFVWTQAQMSLSGQRHVDWRKIVLNTNLIALFVGLILCAAQWRIPDTLDRAMSGLSAAVGPMSMLVIGMTIAARDLKTVFLNGRVWLIAIGRLVVMPLISIGLLLVTGVLRRMPALVPVLQVTMMALAAPPATSVAQLAVLYDNEPEQASAYNVLGMICCVLTMPAMIWLYQQIFG